MAENNHDITLAEHKLIHEAISSPSHSAGGQHTAAAASGGSEGHWGLHTSDDKYSHGTYEAAKK